MSEKSLVEPRLLKGMQDFLPQREIARERLVRTIREVFESFGFQPLSTPCLEPVDVLLGADYGSDNTGQIFSFKGPDETDMGLRFDLTAPLARVVALYPELPKPFRRYQYAPVWRNDKPGPGRFREFTQFDLDIIGTTSMVADAEIIAIMATVMRALKVGPFTVRFSDRKVLDGLAEFAGLNPATAREVFRVLDKLDKVGLQNVLLELGPGRVDVSGDPITGLRLGPEPISRIACFLELPSRGREDVLASADKMLGVTPTGRAGLAELREICTYLDVMGVPADEAVVDLTVARGLGYYTGPVFETTIDALAKYGSVFSGGRYDTLVARFQDTPIPGTGSSVGVDRLLAALVEAELIAVDRSSVDVLVTVMDRERISDYLALANGLRGNGFRTEVYLGEAKGIGKQIQYADRVGIPVAVIAGSNEFTDGTITVKDLVAGRAKALAVANRKEWLAAGEIQWTIPMAELPELIDRILKTGVHELSVTPKQ